VYIIHGKEAAGVEISRGRCSRYKCSEAVRDITRAMTNSSSCMSAYLHMAPEKSLSPIYLAQRRAPSTACCDIARAQQEMAAAACTFSQYTSTHTHS